MSRISRRSVLGMGVTGLSVSMISPALGSLQRSKKKPKNIIFCVADGMAASVPTMVDHLLEIRDGKPSYWRWLMNQDFAVNGLQDTRSLNSVVTDSSAASSSWGCGQHIWNGMVNMYPDGTKLRTLVQILKEAKMRTGLVTTATITHATPAGFAVNCLQRDLEGLIAEEYLKTGVDVLMGGGDKFFDPSKRKDGRDLYKDFASAGYTICKDRDSILRAKAGKILGIVSNGHVPYTVDRDNSPELQKSTPTLAEMTKVAIDNLNTGSGGFLLQIEGARVDHAGHGNDFAGMIYDQIAFEEAVKVAVDFALKDGETLVIITADHATGGVALNGAGDEYIESTAGLKSVLAMKASYDVIFGELGANPDAKMVQDVIEKRLSIKLTPEEAQAVVDGAKSPFQLSTFKKSKSAVLGMVLGNYSKVGFTSGNHTSDHVLVTAVGPMKELCHGIVQNTSFFDIMLAARDVKVDNPKMTFEDAARHYEKMKSKSDGELFALYGDPEEELEHGYRRLG